MAVLYFDVIDEGIEGGDLAVAPYFHATVDVLPQLSHTEHKDDWYLDFYGPFMGFRNELTPTMEHSDGEFNTMQVYDPVVPVRVTVLDDPDDKVYGYFIKLDRARQLMRKLGDDSTKNYELVLSEPYALRGDIKWILRLKRESRVCTYCIIENRISPPPTAGPMPYVYPVVGRATLVCSTHEAMFNREFADNRRQ